MARTQERRPRRGFVLACLAIILVLLSSSPAAAQQDTVPRDTIRTVPDTLPTPPPNTLEQDLSGNRLLDASFPGSWGIPGTNARIGIFGFVKADYLQDIRPNTNRFEFTIPTIPLEGTPEADRGAQASFHAKSSRFVMNARSITESGMPLQAMISFDMGWDDPSFDDFLRLRMAYVVVGNVLAGQAWSTFADLSALLYTLDFEGGDALIGDRNPMFRYTGHINDNWTWAAAVEEAKGQVVNASGEAGEVRRATPELIGRIRWESGRSHVQLAGLANQLRWTFDDGSDAATTFKYGGNLTGLFVFGKGDTEMVTFGVAGGEGLASWSPTTSAEPLDAVLTPSGELETLPFLEYNAGFRHNWSPKLANTVTWAHDKVWLNDLQDDDTFSEGGAFHVNLLWTPYKSVLTGIEYIWGYWKSKDGRKGIADRIQVSLKWTFNP